MKHVHLFIILLVSLATFANAGIERRAAVDVGSGGTKVTIADVDMETNRIIQIVEDLSFPVAYQNALDKSVDGKFDSTTRALGIHTFKKIQEIANHHQVDKITAIATSAFRKANNSKKFVSEIEQQTGLCVQVISQREEGEIAFYSALAKGDLNPDEVIVWDIGTGSLQMTTASSDEGLTVYMGEDMGSVAFKNYIVGELQDHDIEDTISPNPMSKEDLKAADCYARAFARQAYPVFKQKIQADFPVVGIGRLFYHSIRPIACEDGFITRKGLRTFIIESLDKTDEELNNPYAHVDVSNCILTLAVMKALHIQKILPVDTTTTKGLLVSPTYWE